MILFVFEGRKDEPKIMATLKYLFFRNGPEQVLCSFGTDTYTLWKEVQCHQKDGFEADVFQIVKERLHTRDDNSLDKYKSYQIDSIYLIFDYDPQNKKLGMDKLNSALHSLVRTFNNPMESGQLYISYPMVEALFCEDSFNDDKFVSSKVFLSDCSDFKKWCKKYAVAAKKNSLIFKTNKNHEIADSISDCCEEEVKDRWKKLVVSNVKKANYICNGSDCFSEVVENISQEIIFEKEIALYVSPAQEVAILSSFPFFLCDYFRGKGIFEFQQ